MTARSLVNTERSGVRHLAADPKDIEQLAKTLGLVVVRVDLARLASKTGLLGRTARTLRFPEWFGNNWDALYDCLTDLSWLDGNGWVLIFENAKGFAERKSRLFENAIEVFQAASDYWRRAGKPFWVLFHGPSDWASSLERFDPADFEHAAG
jgi:RNAse (barnase) inhibitor barstar